MNAKIYGRWAGLLSAALALIMLSQPSRSQPTPLHTLTIDDVLDIQRLDRATVSPDGEWAALVVQRPARAGEVYGRNAYEVDPARSDIWLVSLRTGERRAITNGSPQAAGYWCATWSPDGQRLALLSTQPENNEPRGGDNVRLYMWERATGALSRLGEAAVMTQTRYGGALDKVDLRGGADRGTVAHACSDGEENAPFLWLDAHRLLMLALPKGQVSGLIDQYGRPFRTAAEDAAALRGGAEATGRAVGSGAARMPRDEGANHALLRTVNVTTGAAATIAAIPTYPFRGALTVAVAPNGRQAALLSTLGALPPQADRTLPNAGDDMWTVERRLGFVDLAPDSPIRWTKLPDAARYPLALHQWSPDGRHVALRGRADRFVEATSLFVVAARDGRTTQITTPSIAKHGWDSSSPLQSPVLWADDRQLVTRLPGTTPDARSDWWLLGIDGKAANLSHAANAVPSAFQRTGDGGLVAIAEGELLRLDAAQRRLSPIVRLDGAASLAWPQDPGRPTDKLLVQYQTEAAGFQMLSTNGRAGRRLPLAGGALLDVDPSRDTMLWSETSRSGVSVRAGSLADGSTRTLFGLNRFMGNIHWGSTQLIDYANADGTALRGAVILPPDYRPGHRYPTLVWVYQGYRVGSLEGDYFLDPYLPGIYNLQLYAARGYVVLIPSMPMPPSSERDAGYPKMAGDVLPAIDKLVALGIADPDRVGVMGQSRGGYTVYALLAQTDRFKAGVAMAGISDLAAFFGEFDPAARGYPGIEHEKSDNWAEVDQFARMVPPVQDPHGYAAVSPLSYVDRVRTPLLMIHGDHDMRGSSTQAERFFYALYAQGKTARLVRYGGESHSLAQSPANVRDIFARTIDWFDTYLGHPAAPR